MGFHQVSMIVPSIRALAPLTGLSHTALNKHLKAGRFQAEPAGGFDPEKVRAALGLPAASPGQPLEQPAAGMGIELWPIDRPVPYPKNARKWSERAIATVAASIREYGFRQPIVVDAAGVIVIGHLRLAAAKSIELKEVPVHVARDLTPAQIKGLRIADNRTSQEATWDFDLLGPELLDLKSMDFDLSLTGFDTSEISGLLIKADLPAAGQTEDDAVPEPPVEPVTVLGDLWLLGDHRVLCGDSTSTDATSRLCGGKKPDLCFTDPPYGINIVKTANDSKEGVVVGAKPYGNQGVVGGGGSAGAMYPFGGVKKGVVVGENIVKPKMYAPVINDESTDTAQEFYHCALASGVEHFIIFGGNYFTAFLPASACWVIWDKQNSGNFAAVEMAWTSFDRGAKLYSFMWNGLARQGDRKTELATRVHPTQKPVGLFEQIFADFPFTICLDGFLGSGSTLIACEKTRRTCYGMELSPDYVDVIVTRWQAFTGKQATLDGDGRTFDELKAARTASQAAA
jgi:hypothetical protein